ncbi:MAG: acyl-ACP--UDP-N-acetylglucosamine O-acyltransferase [Xanthomonadales bacterium]|nr:acyl-ACP--UDP-N-acetylglucosamine O-acyltransferase [Gammaproteobacteria bacterium]NNE06391.1 acyl-ACP--UDP-N-acetylglucosamine O-acyltransferase [Xanthomonadales bacterium]NNL94424.1 acyl-ACP--UDP-N-acetylglucosamine O-acyltransferase [Xanthomonadales bacterium]
MRAHETAIIDSGAEIDEDVDIGAYSIVGPSVRIAGGTRIGPHVVVSGKTTIGKNNRFFQFSSIGEVPQDKKYAGEETELIIGDDNTIREFCTFNIGTVQGGGVTRIGNDNWIMAYVHIAHDCIIGNHVIMANNSTLGGHCTVGDHAILSGFSLVHQFVEIGDHSFISFASHVNRSIPPYVTVAGEKAKARGVNTEGLKRRGFTPEQVQNVRRAYRTLYRSGLSLDEARQKLAEMAKHSTEIEPLVTFLDQVDRSIIR